MASDPQMYEFIIPSEILVADPVDWSPLLASRDGIEMSLHKPFTGQKLVSLERAYGNQSTQIGYSIFHVVLLKEENRIPDWSIPFKLVNDCLQWIRVKGLQYWVGSMPTMRKDVARGSMMLGEKRSVGFVGSVCPVQVNPLTQEMWEWIGTQLAKDRLPNIPDLLVSDALISFTNGDFLQTAIRLGVICELALNAFIDDLLTLQPPVARLLYEERKPFREKLKNIPGVLRAEKYQEYDQHQFKQLVTLYDLRGAAIHRAKLEINGQPINEEHVSKFIYSTLHFLNWSQDQRAKLNIPI